MRRHGPSLTYARTVVCLTLTLSPSGGEGIRTTPSPSGGRGPLRFCAVAAGVLNEEVDGPNDNDPHGSTVSLPSVPAVSPTTLALLSAIAFGLCVGSFLNVVIARLPAGRSIVFPPSACPRCGHLIAWYDNVPVLSWLLLRARCRNCRQPISWRYPVVEALAGALFAMGLLRFGIGFDLLVALLFLVGLIVIAGIDFDRQIIPDSITLPGIVAGFTLSLAAGDGRWKSSAIGIFVGGGLFVVIILLSMLLMGQPGMGGGDVKLGAMIGAFLGWKLVLLSSLVSVFVGGPLALVLLVTGRKGRKDPLPFGPFLALGGAISLFWGNAILAWYWNRFIG